MSTQKNARLIGAFVLGALILALGAVTVIGGLRIFRDKQLAVVYFDGSVNGLGVGSPVKFKGIEVGRVESLSLNFVSPTGDLSDFHIPVVIDLYPDLLAARGVELNIHDPATYDRLIGQGLRATLAVESFVTGVLYVNLDFADASDAANARFFNDPAFPYPEIPAGGTTLEAVQTNISRIVERLAQADVPLLIDSLTAMAGALSRAAGTLNTREVLESVDRTLTLVDGALSQLTELTDSIGNSLGPIVAQFDSTARAVRNTLDSTSGTLADLSGSLDPRGPVFVRAEEAMLELARAARAFQELAQTLERNPSILLRGREGGER